MKRIELMLAALAGGVLLWGGCSSGPSRIGVPDFDSEGSAERAMELHDKDGDGALSGDELDGAPGLKAAIKTVDADADGKITPGEIANRIEAWQNGRVGLTSVRATITLDGQPLGGAVVTFDPEDFLSADLQEAEGETGPGGDANISIPKDKRPSPDMPPGLRLGFYRVRVSKMVGGKETVPERFNSATELGQEVALDDPKMLSNTVKFDLKSK